MTGWRRLWNDRTLRLMWALAATTGAADAHVLGVGIIAAGGAGVEFGETTADRRARDPGRGRDEGDATAPQCPGLAGSPVTLRLLMEQRREHFILLPNTVESCGFCHGVIMGRLQGFGNIILEQLLTRGSTLDSESTREKAES